MYAALVTGGGGFIGSHVVERLLELGHRVRVLDSFDTGKPENLAHVRDRIDLVRGDVRDHAVCRAACEGIAIVFHLAPLPSVPLSVEEPIRTFDVTLGGTNAILAAARQAGVRRVVQASSSAIYGDDPALPKHEELLPRPRSPYAAHKLAAEQLGVAFAASVGLEVVALRLFNVFGPRQDPKSLYAAVVPKFVTACLAGEAPTIHGDGEQTRDFVYVGDVAAAFALAADAPGASGGVFNIALGERISVNRLFELISRAAGVPGLAAKHEPARAGDVKHSVASVEAARRGLGFTPGVSLAEGLARTVEWYRP